MKRMFILLIVLFCLTGCNDKQSSEVDYSDINEKKLDLEIMISDNAAVIMVNELKGQENKMHKINLTYSSAG